MWDFQLLRAGRYIGSSRADGTDVGLVYGMRGAWYRLQLYAYPHEPLKDDYCRSDIVPLTATDRMAPVHIGRAVPTQRVLLTDTLAAEPPADR